MKITDPIIIAEALARGLIRFAKFLGAKRVDVSTITPRSLRLQVQRAIKNFVT